MEFAGEDAARLMQEWINEAFVYLSGKREKGNYDPEEERRIRHELQIHDFEGKNVDNWFCLMEDSFDFFQLDNETRFKAAILAFNDEVRKWFEGNSQYRQVCGWTDLRRLLDNQFGGIKEGFDEGFIGEVLEGEEGEEDEEGGEDYEEKGDQTLNTSTVGWVATQTPTEKDKENGKEKQKGEKKGCKEGKDNLPERDPSSFVEHKYGGGSNGNHRFEAPGYTPHQRERLKEGSAGACGSGGGPGFSGGFTGEVEVDGVVSHPWVATAWRQDKRPSGVGEAWKKEKGGRTPEDAGRVGPWRQEPKSHGGCCLEKREGKSHEGISGERVRVCLLCGLKEVTGRVIIVKVPCIHKQNEKTRMGGGGNVPK